MSQSTNTDRIRSLANGLNTHSYRTEIAMSSTIQSISSILDDVSYRYSEYYVRSAVDTVRDVVRELSNLSGNLKYDQGELYKNLLLVADMYEEQEAKHAASMNLYGFDYAQGGYWSYGYNCSSLGWIWYGDYVVVDGQNFYITAPPFRMENGELVETGYDGGMIETTVSANVEPESGLIMEWNELEVGTGAQIDCDVEAGEIKMIGTLDAEYEILDLEAEGSYGFASGNAGLEVGSADATLEGGAVLFDNGTIDPNLYAKAEVSGSVLTGELDGTLGSEDYNVHGGLEGEVLTADASAEVQIGTDGIAAEAKAHAAVVEGEASVGFTLFGISVDATVEGDALSIGAGGSIGVTDDEFELGAKLSALLGVGIKLRLSW